MKPNMLRFLTLACAVFLGGAATAADDVTQCGSKQLKAAVSLILSGPYKEAARACAAADNPANAADEVNDDKMTAATEKFNKLVTSTVEKYGQESCFVEDSAGQTVDPADVIATTEGLATGLCTPSP